MENFRTVRIGTFIVVRIQKNQANKHWQYDHLLIMQLINIIMIIERDKLSTSVLFEHGRLDSSNASQTIWQSF